jgi:hypothetical protein
VFGLVKLDYGRRIMLVRLGYVVSYLSVTLDSVSLGKVSLGSLG